MKTRTLSTASIVRRRASCSTLGTILCLSFACSDTTLERGLEVGISTIAPNVSAKTFTTNRGVSLRIVRAFLVTHSAELLQCPPTAFERARSILAMRSAYAHGTATATRLATPVVEDMLRAPRASTFLGTLRPPPGDYCTLRYSIGAADDDALGLPTEVNIVGESLHIEGTYALVANPVSTPFVIATSVSFDRDLELNRMMLSASGRQSAAIAIGKSMETWFDGIDFATASSEELAAAVTARVRASLVATWE
jgi:hypothetical protein